MTNAELRRCTACRRYTLSEVCPDCKARTGNPHPARFSPEDRYARYRRALLAEAAKERAREPEAAPTSTPGPEQH